MAHLDTVPLCEGCRPKRVGSRIRSADPKTALGGDDRGGVAAVLTGVIEMLKQKLPHPPVTVFLPVQEELGMLGVRFGSLAKLGRPKLCFNWDGGPAHELVLGGTGANAMEITVHGIAAHAGMHPDHGVSAVAISGLAIADLHRSGWFGAVKKGKQRGTSNIGVISGGEATNVVTDRVVLRGEARSHEKRFRARIVSAYRSAFERAARGVRNHEGRCGKVAFKDALKYEPFVLKEKEPCVVEATRVLGALGLNATFRVVSRGMDANWMSARGFPTVTLGNGQKSPHTVNEKLFVDEYLKGCRVALRLATGL